MFYLFQELQLCTIPKIVFKLKSFGALVAVCAAAVRRAAAFAARDELHYSCIFSTYLVCSTYIIHTGYTCKAVTVSKSLESDLENKYFRGSKMKFLGHISKGETKLIWRNTENACGL